MAKRKQCIAIATDIMNSRVIDIDPILGELKDTLNHKYTNVLLTPFDIRLGDELIGALSKFSEAYNLIQELEKFMTKYNLRMYVGIGFGFIDTAELTNIHRVNGSAIRSAIKARDVMRDNLHSQPATNRKTHLLQKRNLFISSYAEENDVPYKAINHYIRYLQEKVENRSAAQNQVIQIHESHPELTLEEIGEQIGQSKSGVSNLLKRADYQQVADAQQALKELLDYIQHKYQS